MALIDVALRAEVDDGRRRFALDMAFTGDAPVLALYGPSGSGKSLTLQALAGLLPGVRGHVRIGGRTLLDSAAGIALPPPARGIGYLFQQYALFPHLSVRDNIAFGLGRPGFAGLGRRLDAAERARVDALIDRFGLGPLARSRPATLSGGQQQRVALARALACAPQALLLDEPFAALHPALRQQLRAELKAERARAGIPAVLITHDLDDVLELADRACLVDEGRVVRTLDLHDARARALAGEALRPPGSRSDAPGDAALRALLSAPPAPPDAAR